MEICTKGHSFCSRCDPVLYGSGLHFAADRDEKRFVYGGRLRTIGSA